ncbi:hypothetical protein B296_00042304 [Ensete ventricosum]|uniref:Uncharacterized protein n=1 Tax=Ensete ventricosum TaxID=4639 RepID=A0A426ZJ15_ENSVE|nr:hypothetical protein B296_00042304 [Ensete ventricosum]
MGLEPRIALSSGKTLYCPVHTGPAADLYADRPLPGGTTKIDRRWSIEGEIDRRRSIEGEKGKKKKKRRRRKKKKRIRTSFPPSSSPMRRPRLRAILLPRVETERLPHEETKRLPA